MPNHRVSTRLFMVALVCVGIFNCDRAPAEVNVPGKPETWFGSATREDIGHVVDYVECDVDPRNTFAKHEGRKADEKTSFTFRIPKGGRYVLAYCNILNKSSSLVVRYKSGDRWVELPPGRIDPDYFREWDWREFCYWIDIPEGQETVRFEIPGTRMRGALLAEPRLDPFEGMPGRSPDPMFEIPDAKEVRESELGRAILYGVWRDADPTKAMTDEAFAKARQSLAGYERMQGAKYITNQKQAWSVALGGLTYRVSGDKRYALIAGRKARRIAAWPTWGYSSEWNVDQSLVVPPLRKRTFERNHTLSTTIKTSAMAIGYDLACGGMAEEDRAVFRKALDRYAHLMYVRSFLNPGIWYGGGNWGGHFRACIGLSGAALLGEGRYAGDWLDRYEDALELSVETLVDPHGLPGETIQYAGFGINPSALASLAVKRRRGGESVFDIAGGRMSKLLRTTIYLASPNGQTTRDFGDTGDELQLRAHGGMPDNIETMLLAMTHSARPELARWAARRGLHRFSSGKRQHVMANQGRGPVMNFLLFRPGPERSPGDYGDFPLGWHERCPTDYPRDRGHVVMRTGFDSPDDIKLYLRCGHSEGYHGHPSQGSFTLDAYGDYLSQPPGYNLWARNTRAYNLVTIDGKGQASDHKDGRDVNDGHVERFVHSPVADLCIANNKPAYDGGGNPVKRSLRYVLFVRKPERRGYFVVVDDIEKDDKQRRYTWNFHTSANHRIETDGERGFVARGLSRAETIELWKNRGGEKALTALSLGGDPKSGWYAYRWPGPSKRYPQVKEVKVDLRLQFIHPQKFTHAIGFEVPRWRGAKTTHYVPDHLEVTQRMAEGLFLVILYPEREDFGIEMPKLDRIAEDRLWGAKLGGDTILFSRRQGTWKHGDIETDGRLVYVQRDEGGKPTGFAVAEATTLKVAGEEIFESDRRVTAAGSPGESVTDDGGEWRTSGAERGMP